MVGINHPIGILLGVPICVENHVILIGIENYVNPKKDKEYVAPLEHYLWEAISVQSGMTSRLVIKKSIAMQEVINW